jgi:hypothetical protein
VKLELAISSQFGHGVVTCYMDRREIGVGLSSVKLGFDVQHIHKDGTFNACGTHNKSRIGKIYTKLDLGLYLHYGAR